MPEPLPTLTPLAKEILCALPCAEAQGGYTVPEFTAITAKYAFLPTMAESEVVEALHALRDKGLATEGGGEWKASPVGLEAATQPPEVEASQAPPSAVVIEPMPIKASSKASA